MTRAFENRCVHPQRTRVGRVVVAGLALLMHHPAVADIGNLTTAHDYRNSVTIGTAGGVAASKDAPAHSFSVSYDRNIVGPWGVFVGIGWEQEYRKVRTDRLRGQSIDLGFGATYDASDQLGFGLGLTKTLSGKEEDDDWRTEAADNAWSIYFGVGYSFDLTERVSWGPGLTVSYDIDSEEARLDLDISVSFAF